METYDLTNPRFGIEYSNIRIRSNKNADHWLKGPNVEGQQFFNHSIVDDTTMRFMSTYVEQDDHLTGSLTVAETIEFAAKLALPRSVSSAERS